MKIRFAPFAEIGTSAGAIGTPILQRLRDANARLSRSAGEPPPPRALPVNPSSRGRLALRPLVAAATSRCLASRTRHQPATGVICWAVRVASLLTVRIRPYDYCAGQLREGCFAHSRNRYFDPLVPARVALLSRSLSSRASGGGFFFVEWFLFCSRQLRLAALSAC
jgi:hypothetical protein